MSITVEERFLAGVQLAGIGDALGYKNGQWEFCKSGKRIHEEATHLGGLEGIHLLSWNISDDQVMHIHTGRALIRAAARERDPLSVLLPFLAEEYIASGEDMEGRAPGQTVISSLAYLARYNQERNPGYQASDPNRPLFVLPPGGVPFDKSGGGCGAAMRAMCLGLYFASPDQLPNLIKFAIESGRLTHNHPTGFLGSLVSALFVSYAIQGVPLLEWGRKMVIEVLPLAYAYLQGDAHWTEYQPDLRYFESKWVSYLNLRRISVNDGPTLLEAFFPTPYGVEERDKFYSQLSFKGWGGASGHDSVIIAYDALLGCKASFGELVGRGAWHGGDSDSTGCIAASWYGCLYGFGDVPRHLVSEVEYGPLAKEVAQKLFMIHSCQPCDGTLMDKPHDKIPHSLLESLGKLRDNFNQLRATAETRIEEGKQGDTNRATMVRIIDEELTKLLCAVDGLKGAQIREERKQLIGDIERFSQELNHGA